jgi:hypothetical protein
MARVKDCDEIAHRVWDDSNMNQLPKTRSGKIMRRRAQSEGPGIAGGRPLDPGGVSV